MPKNYKVYKIKKNNGWIMHAWTICKFSDYEQNTGKFQKDQNKIEGGVEFTKYPLIAFEMLKTTKYTSGKKVQTTCTSSDVIIYKFNTVKWNRILTMGLEQVHS